MTGNARNSFDIQDPERWALFPLAYGAMGDPQLAGYPELQASCFRKKGLDISHANLDSTTNIAHASEIVSRTVCSPGRWR